MTKGRVRRGRQVLKTKQVLTAVCPVTVSLSKVNVKRA